MALLQPFGVKRHADPVVPDDLHQRADPTPEHEQIAAVRITVELLHDEREALHAFPHIGVAHGDPHPRARRDHRSAFSVAAASAGDAEAKMLTRLPRSSSMTMAGAVPEGGDAGSSTRMASEPDPKVVEQYQYVVIQAVFAKRWSELRIPTKWAGRTDLKWATAPMRSGPPIPIRKRAIREAPAWVVVDDLSNGV
jgi:hypothetical protein